MADFKSDSPCAPAAHSEADTHYTRRQKTMIDILPLNAVMCDPNEDFKIVYVNQQSKATLRSIEHLLPCGVDENLA